MVAVFFLGPIICRYLGDGDTDRREILHGIGPRQKVSPFGGDAPRRIPKSQILGLNFGHLTANISKTVSPAALHLN